jgi:hypothetical protein
MTGARRKAMARRYGGLLALLLLLPGCAKDKCKGLEPAIEVTLNANPALARSVRRIEVSFRAGVIEKSHSYAIDDGQLDDGVTSFVIYSGTPRDELISVTVEIVARNEAGLEVGRAAAFNRALEGNACNFLSLDLRQRSAGDGVRDQGPPDTSPPEDGPRPDKGSGDAFCGPASASCWDVWAQFTKTDCAYFQPQIFGQKIVLNQKTYAIFDGREDNTYMEDKEELPSGCTTARAMTWHIERKRRAAHTYALLVRGISDADCWSYCKRQPWCAGEIQLNTARGWKITQKVKCSIATDNNNYNVTIPTYCDAPIGQGKISWQSGSACGGCCGCPDGAVVDIEVVVSNL